MAALGFGAMGCGDADKTDAPTVAGGDTVTSMSVDTTTPIVPGEPAVGAGPSQPSDLPGAPPRAVTSPGTSVDRPSAAVADSAGRILQRAAAKYSTVKSLQADFTMSYENPLLRSRTTGRGALYQQRPDRLLLRFSEPAGDVIMSDGRYFWVYYPSVDAQQVIRSPASAGGNTGVDLQAQFLGNPTERFSYALDGQESVAGRNAWVFTLTPRERMGYRRLRVWLDQRDLLARRFEITEDNGSVRRFDLRNLRVDPVLNETLFRFTPPQGARVITR